MQEKLSHVGSSCGCDGQTARDSIRVPPSLPRSTKSCLAKPRQRRRRQAGRQTAPRDGGDEGRWISLFYFWKEKKGRAVKKKRAREKQLQARLLLSPHLSCVLEKNELQLIKTVCAAAAVEKGKQHLCRRDTNFVISSSVIEQQGFLFFFIYLKRNEGEKTV